MNFADMLREIIASAKKTATGISKEIGRSSSFLSTSFYEDKPLRVDTLAALCDACGYEVVVRGHGHEYTLVPSGSGKEVSITVNVGEDYHWWHMTPAIADTNKPQTAVFEDRYGARLLVDFRILSDLAGRGWGIGWDEDLILSNEPPTDVDS